MKRNFEVEEWENARNVRNPVLCEHIVTWSKAWLGNRRKVKGVADKPGAIPHA